MNKLIRFKYWLSVLWNRGQANDWLPLGGIAVLVGVATGLGVWLFKQLITLFQNLAFTQFGGLLAPLGKWSIALIPITGGLIVGWIVYRYIGPERHHGVAGVMEAVAIGGGRLRYKRIPAKALAAALAIGSGASVGPEDPSVQIGANLGSMFGQWLHFSDDRVKALVAAGAASGIAAAFNAPIAGVFFALEIVLGEISGNAFGIVMVAGVASAVFTQAVSGVQPAFKVPTYALGSVWELPLYLVLGLLAGPLAAFYIRAIYAATDFFSHRNLPRWLKPAIAGLAVGVTGIFLPQVFGVGYDTIEITLGGAEHVIWLLLVLCIAKLLLTAISIGGGFPGGVFAPSLFLGATLGAAYGQFCGMIFPHLNIAPQAFAMVGMAAVLAGTVHAPLTAVILLFEMTNDYRVILPLMFAVTISLLVSRAIHRDSVYTLALARKGIRLQRGKDVEVLEGIQVEEVMEKEFPILSETDPISTAAEILMVKRRHGLPVMDHDNNLVGVFTIQDLDHAQIRPDAETITIGKTCSRDLEVAYPDEDIGTVLRRMSPRDIGRLPVVSRDDPRHLVGLLRRSDIIRAYDVALKRRAAIHHRANEVRLGAFSGVNIEEVRIEHGSVCAGQRMSTIPWPQDCLVATLRRGRIVLIPHGNTVLQVGDVLVAVAEGPARDTIRKLCAEELEKQELSPK